MTHKQFEEFILSLPGVWLDYPFGEDVAVYKFGRDNDVVGTEFTRKVRNGFTGLSLKQETLEYNYLFRSID